MLLTLSTDMYVHTLPYVHQVRDSIDTLIWEAIQNKLDNVGKVLDGKQDYLKVSPGQLPSSVNA